MGLSAEFTEKSENVVNQLHELVDDTLPWRNDLETALSNIAFTPRQEQAIREAATPTTFQGMTDDNMNSLQTRITHAFRDSVANATMVLEMGTIMDEQEEALIALSQIKMTIQDLRHNYPLLLGKNVPNSVQDILDRYRNDVLPQINEMIDELAQSTGINLNGISRNTNYQHIMSLPEKVFSEVIVNE